MLRIALRVRLQRRLASLPTASAQDDTRGDAPLGRQKKALIEHIVRNQNDYETRLNYMYNNPMRWYYDKIYKDE